MVIQAVPAVVFLVGFVVSAVVAIDHPIPRIPTELIVPSCLVVWAAIAFATGFAMFGVSE